MRKYLFILFLGIFGVLFSFNSSFAYLPFQKIVMKNAPSISSEILFVQLPIDSCTRLYGESPEELKGLVPDPYCCDDSVDNRRRCLHKNAHLLLAVREVLSQKIVDEIQFMKGFRLSNEPEDQYEENESACSLSQVNKTINDSTTTLYSLRMLVRNCLNETYEVYGNQYKKLVDGSAKYMNLVDQCFNEDKGWKDKNIKTIGSLVKEQSACYVAEINKLENHLSTLYKIALSLSDAGESEIAVSIPPDPEMNIDSCEAALTAQGGISEECFALSNAERGIVEEDVKKNLPRDPKKKEEKNTCLKKPFSINPTFERFFMDPYCCKTRDEKEMKECLMSNIYQADRVNNYFRDISSEFLDLEGLYCKKSVLQDPITKHNILGPSHNAEEIIDLFIDYSDEFVEILNRLPDRIDTIDECEQSLTECYDDALTARTETAVSLAKQLSFENECSQKLITDMTELIEKIKNYINHVINFSRAGKNPIKRLPEMKDFSTEQCFMRSLSLSPIQGECTNF